MYIRNGAIMSLNKIIYLDNAATTPLCDSVKKYIIDMLNNYGNPSSLHQTGHQAKEILDTSRETIANFIHASAENIYFTSGGSANNTLAIRGYLLKNCCKPIYLPIAHKSITKCLQSMDVPETYKLKVSRDGMIKIDDLENKLSRQPDLQPFVIIEYANSEIGTVQDVQKIIDLTHSYRGIVYLDCVGSISTIPLNVQELDVDLCGFSAHKVGGLKGCGVLYKKNSINLRPLIYGSQEQGLFGGTENVLGIGAMGKAVESIDYKTMDSKNRDYVLNYIENNIANCYLIGSKKHRLIHNLYICFQGIEGEALSTLLDQYGIQVSTGSACNSGEKIPSSTLLNIGMDKEDLHSCIRMTFSGTETKDELDYVCSALARCVNMLRLLKK